MPLHYCVFTLFCIVGGAMVYNEFEHLTTQGWVNPNPNPNLTLTLI